MSAQRAAEREKDPVNGFLDGVPNSYASKIDRPATGTTVGKHRCLQEAIACTGEFRFSGRLLLAPIALLNRSVHVSPEAFSRPSEKRSQARFPRRRGRVDRSRVVR
jgi:hypothetical protein